LRNGCSPRPNGGTAADESVSGKTPPTTTAGRLDLGCAASIIAPANVGSTTTASVGCAVRFRWQSDEVAAGLGNGVGESSAGQKPHAMFPLN
jgi:hypothetical protein